MPWKSPARVDRYIYLDMVFPKYYSGLTTESVEQFVFEYIPRKVSTEPEQATSIVLELTMFWQYVNRVFELPNAMSIIA